MPIFEYICKECDHQFEAWCTASRRRSVPSATAASWRRSSRCLPSAPRAVRRRTVNRRLRLLRRPARAGIMFASQYELGRAVLNLPSSCIEEVTGVTRGTSRRDPGKFSSFAMPLTIPTDHSSLKRHRQLRSPRSTGWIVVAILGSRRSCRYESGCGRP